MGFAPIDMQNSRNRIAPGPGQESAWDYPRPPRLEKVAERLRVMFAGEVIADTTAGYRVLETSHPPTYYIPPQDVRRDVLRAAEGRTFCEFKGHASYWTIAIGERAFERISERAAWSYSDPTPAFLPIRDYLAFYASRVDECYVGDERVQPQQSDFYGGWVTSRIVGPFKGAAGTRNW